MNILFLTQYFPPEIGAAADRVFGLANHLANRGHRITVITAFPNYPKGVVHKRYKGKFMVEEREGNIKVIRTYLYTSIKKNFIRRTLNYLSFMITSLIGGFQVKDCEIIFATSPPIFVGLSGYFMSMVKKIPYILDVRDIWPESAVVLGMLKNKFLIGFMRLVEKFIYHKASKITTATEGIRRYIIEEMGFGENRVVFLPNGIDIDLYDNISAEDVKEVKESYGLSDKFVVGYIGNHGLAQKLETVLECAKMLKDRGDIVFVFIGDGVRKDHLVKLREMWDLENIVFVDEQPKRKIPVFLKSMDVALVPLRRDNLFQGALPSKMFEYMGAGCPIVLSIKGEAEDVLNAACCGIAVEPENPSQMREAITKLYSDERLRRKFSLNGRNFVREHYLRFQIAGELEEILMRLIEKRGEEGEELSCELRY